MGLSPIEFFWPYGALSSDHRAQSLVRVFGMRTRLLSFSITVIFLLGLANGVGAQDAGAVGMAISAPGIAAFYWQANDGITVRPGFFFASTTSSGNQERNLETS